MFVKDLPQISRTSPVDLTLRVLQSHRNHGTNIFPLFRFILTIVFLHHDLAKLKPAWFCSRCSVVSVYSDVKAIIIQHVHYEKVRHSLIETMALSTRNCHTLCFLTFRRDSLTDFCTLQPPIFGVPNTISYLCRTKELFIIYPFCSYVILSFNMFLCQKICISVRSTGNLREMYGIC